jgi:ferredoxin-NADP reductase
LARPTYAARLVDKACISESAQCYHLEFAIDEMERWDWVPGQFLSAVAVDPRGKTQTRAYSIASAPQGNRFDLCINRVEGGFFSNHLADLSIGDTIQVHGPHGNFTLRAPLTDSIFVATGTGIAPMRAFTQGLFPSHGPNAGADLSEGRRIWVLYGTRYESELYYRDYFESIAAEHPNFHYIATLSRAPQEWGGLRGYVQDHLAPIIEERGGDKNAGGEVLPGLPPQAPVFDIHTYICGLNNMVAGVRDLLAGHGWHKKQIIFERYD